AIALHVVVAAWRKGLVPDIAFVARIAIRKKGDVADAGLHRKLDSSWYDWFEGFLDGLGLGGSALEEATVAIAVTAVSMYLDQLTPDEDDEALVADITGQAVNAYLTSTLSKERLEQIGASLAGKASIPPITKNVRRDIQDELEKFLERATDRTKTHPA